MRRIIIIGTALAVLGGGAAALAAGSFNNYKASETFSPVKSGSAKHPSPMSITEDWKASGTNGHPTAPLTKIVAKIYGMKTYGQDFPTCTAAKINGDGANTGKWNKVCPKASLIGQGPVESVFVNPNPPYNVIGTCDPYLWIYNGGAKTQVFFFTEDTFTPNPSKYKCLGGNVHTGAAPAYNGHISMSGKTWVLTIPLPGSVSTNAGGTGLYASLQHLHVHYSHKNIKKNGKTIGYGMSVACQSNKRPWSFAYTAQNYNGLSPHTQTVVKGGKPSC